MDTPLLVGSLGGLIILILFLLNQGNKLKNDNIYYDLFNFIGSLLLILYALMINSIPFIILNIVWAGYSLKDVISKLLKQKNIKLVVRENNNSD